MKLSTARVNLALAMQGALPDAIGVVDHLPDSIAAPCVLIGWSDPWLKPSTYCAYEAAMEVMVVAQRIEPGGKLETLEEIMDIALGSIKAIHEYQVVDVTAPFPLQLGGVDYLAASINITYDVEG